MTDHRGSQSYSLALDNKGFSIVELIVCVAILAIAAIPLYQSMTLSARTNAKAQSKQNATSLAESVMEEIKASSIDELKEKYNGTETNAEGLAVPKTINLGKDETTFFGIAGSETSAESRRSSAATAASNTDRFLTGDYVSTKAPFYVLYKKDEVSTQGEEFDVVATFRTSTYMNGAAVNAANANTKKLPKIEEIDPHSQAVITVKEFSKYDKAALDFFQQNGASRDATKSITSKEIFIDKYDTPGAIYDQVSVDCRVTYTDNSSPANTYQRDLFSGTFGQPVKVEGGSTIKRPLASNIYLFYKRTQPIEKIKVNDTATKGTHKVFLVMQETGVSSLLIKPAADKYTEVNINDVITLKKNDELDENGNIVDGNLELITNMTQTGSLDGHVYNEESRIRIYDVNVSLVKDGKEYASLNSTKEANDENK